jgi:exodeoxyribonuclease VII small subunit
MTAEDGAPSPGESFDQILKQLQDVVEGLEQSDLTLEQSLEMFERGVMLSRQGQKILDAAESKVEALLDDGTTKPIEG